MRHFGYWLLGLVVLFGSYPFSDLFGKHADLAFVVIVLVSAYCLGRGIVSLFR